MAQKNRAVCDLSNTVSVKTDCVDCNSNLCEACNSREPKDDFGTHLTPSGSTESQGSDQQEIPCSIHENEKCYLFCTICSVPVCSSCIVDFHQFHSFDKVGVAYNKQVQKLKSLRYKIEEALSCFSDNLHKARHNYNDLKQKVLARERNIKIEATERAKCLVKELDRSCMDINLQKRKAEIDKALQSRDITTILKTTNQINMTLPPEAFNEMQMQKITFLVPRSLNFGSLMKNPEFKIIKTYETNEPYILDMMTLRDGTNVIHSGSTLKYGVFKNSMCVFTSSEIDLENVDFNSMTETENGIILFSGYFESDIMEINSKNKINKLASFGPKCISTLYATKHQTIVLGCVGDHPTITIVDMQGNIKKEFRIEDRNIRAQIPWRITMNVNGDICVILLDNEECLTGQVVVLGPQGQIRWYYSGHESVNSKTNFGPSGIATSASGLVIVLDFYTKTLHVMTMDGEFITSFGEREGISDFNRMTAICDGSLRLVCRGVTFAKIVVVKISD